MNFLGQVKCAGNSGMLFILDEHLPSLCIYEVCLLGSKVNFILHNIESNISALKLVFTAAKVYNSQIIFYLYIDERYIYYYNYTRYGVLF